MNKQVQLKIKYRYGPSGIHIYDRTNGLNILIDEIRIQPSIWTIAPRHVSIAVTNKCDFSCSYCFAPKHPAELNVEQLICWIDELDEAGCLSVGFGGGEPTLYPHFAELCQYVAQNTGMAVTFTTHGHHLGDALINSLSGNVHFIRISMDGVGKTYEAIRGQSFSKLLSRLKRIRKLSPFGINFVVNSNTFPCLNSAIKYADELKASEFLLLPEQPVNGNAGIDADTILSLRKWVDNYQGNIPLTISEENANGFPGCYPFGNENGLRAFAHIDASGVLKRSSFDSNGISIGRGSVLQALEILGNSKRKERL